MSLSKISAGIAWILFLTSFAWAVTENEWRALWPSVVALSTVLLLRKVLIGLLAGAGAGAIILANGNPVTAFVSFFRDHLVENLQSDWKLGPIIFTFILGGFVALIEKSGGFQGIVHRILKRGGDPSRQVQWSAFVMGLIFFFDGLANSLTVGRVLRTVGDRCGVSRVKLAYIVDSTSSAVACLACISTWIAFQLSLIAEGVQLIEQPLQPYSLFIHSIPYNYYCWFTIILLPIMIVRQFNPGPMRAFEEKAQENITDFRLDLEQPTGHWTSAVIPVLVLIVTILVGLYLNGATDPWPFTLKGLAVAYGKAVAPLVLIVASALAAAVATLLYPRQLAAIDPPSKVFLEGVQSLFIPILILISAWMLSSTLSDLGAGVVLSRLLAGHIPLWLLPGTVFLVGALTSFSTGSSWGTMAIIMPLAIPVTFMMSEQTPGHDLSVMLATVIGAVFSGAVFGDHCSPISDTTIVSSIACDIEPHDHVRTQMPYALTGALIALLFGFIPAGLSLSPWAGLIAGTVVLWLVAGLSSKGKENLPKRK